MNKGQNTRGYDRYLAFDIHREYILVGGQNEDQEWVLTPGGLVSRSCQNGGRKFLQRGYCGAGNDHECVGDL